MSYRARFVGAVPVRVVLRLLFAALLIGVATVDVPLQAQSGSGSSQQTLVPGRNVNMVSGTQWPNGDPYLQRQNEPSIAASTRNPLHLLAGANDYRTVDVPFPFALDPNGDPSDAPVTGDAWLGLFKSFDGGQRWQSTLLPGYPQDTSLEGLASPIYGYQAGADPVVRAGTNGLFYYAGLVFDREENGRNAIFVARFIDDNNKEAKFKEAGYQSANDPVRYLGASLVARSDGRVFLDKPWMAVDVPRLGARACRIDTPGAGGSGVQRILGGHIYVAYTAFTEDAQGPKSQIYLTRSEDCGRTWLPSVRISNAADRLNQGSTIAIDPRNGTVYVAWRRFSPDTSAGSNADTGDGFMVSRSTDWGRRFSTPRLTWALSRGRGRKVGLDMGRFFEHRMKKRGREDRDERVAADRGRSPGKSRVKPPASIGLEANEFDQATSDIDGLLAFRTNMYATMTVDGDGRVYLAWAERGYGTVRPDTDLGDARIVISTSTDGRSWTLPVPVADEGQAGHQIMPSLTFGGGKLVLVYYDLRDDITRLASPWIDDVSAAPTGKRRTLDLRASYGTPGPAPVFDNSIRVSDYLFALDSGGQLRQLQFNPPNLPMFAQGTSPFMGDYIDVTVAPMFVPTTGGRWAYNLNGPKPVFHAVWTDNRDVRQPAVDLDGDGNPWNDYTAPTALTNRTASRWDPNTPLPNCNPLNTGSRNQNIYTARLTTGLVVGSPGNSKPLSATLQRAFVVFAQNTTNATKAFRLTIANQPAGGRASFDQFNPAVTSVDVTTPYRSTAARTVYVTSSDPDAQVRVDIVEIAAAGATEPLQGGLSDMVLLNPDIANPDIANPDIANPDIANPDIANAEVYNPDIANPDIANPDIANPDIANPDIANPDIANPDIANPDIANPDIANPDIANPDIANVQVANPDIANPDIANPDIANPDIANPDIANPDIANPDIANPDIANASLTDVTWTMTNNGNTTAAFNVNLFLAQQTDKICQAGQNPDGDGCIATQLILRKVYTTPTAIDCELKVESRNVLLANVRNPRFVTPGSGLPDQNDPSAENATLWLAPGETARITLRVYDPNRYDNIDPSDERPETPTDPDNYVIDPIFLPTTTTSLGAVTPVVQQQSVDSQDVAAVPPGGVPPQPPVVTPLTESVPPAQTPTPLTLAYVTQPSGALAGSPMAPAVQVQVLDQYGATLPNWDVTLYLAANPANASLTGAVATTDALGVATFPAVVVGSAGTGFTLAATSGTALPAVSNPFDVTSSCNPLVVTTSADTNLCGSLRYAITIANGGPLKTITFEIAEPMPHIMAPTTPLPALGSGVIVDATTDSHYALGGGQPVIQISGANMPAGSIGLALTGAGSTVRGIEFNGFVPNASYTSGAALLLAGGGSHTVQANHFGMMASNYTGIEVQSSANLIGGHLPGQGNVIGGNGQSQGVWVRSGAGNRIEGNFIGNNGIAVVGLGLAPWSNDAGVTIDGGATATVIGLAPAGAPPAAPGAGNVISGNNVGVLLRGGTGTEIRGNRIGLNAAGTGAIPNNQGVSAYNLVQNTIIHGNFVSGNSGWGIALQSTGAGAPTGTQILQNTIGLDTAGAALGNVGGGILNVNAGGTIIGAPGSGNVISGNGGHAVLVQGIGTGVGIRSNRIGTDPAGTSARPNGPLGGDLAAVMIASGVSGVQIGGDATAGEGNVISGNSAYGIKIWGTGNSVFGNFIGTNAAGTAALPNVKFGIHVEVGPNNVIGGSAPGQRNVISGNLAAGIALTGQGNYAGATNTQITGNDIGLNAAGTGTIPNGGAGVDVREGASGILTGNTISGNAGAGVLVWQNATGTTISANSIFSNGGLGIDLGNDGVTANDPGDTDTGANGLQNVPVLSAATSAAGSTTQVDFLLVSVATTEFTLEFFANTSCDASGSGEGRRFLGSTSATTGAGSTIAGTASLTELALAGEFITATATDPTGNTSEFSACVQVGALETAIPGTAGGTVNVNFGGGAPAAGGTVPVQVASLSAGQQIIISASGVITTGIGSNGPAGSGTGTDPSFLAPALPALSLVARIGGGPWQPVGAGPTVLTAVAAGIVEVAVNDSFFGDNGGTFQVSVSLSGILSVSPSAVSPYQTVTIRGVGLPGSNVVFTHNGVDYPMNYLWVATTSTVIARLPDNIPLGAATLRVVGTASTTNSFPLTVQGTVGTPANEEVWIGTCTSGGINPTPMTTVAAGQAISVSADGTDSYVAYFRWTPVSGPGAGQPAQEYAQTNTCGGFQGRLPLSTVAPTFPSGTVVRLQVRQVVAAPYSGSAYSTGVLITIQ